jgi:Domain of unknown function (DUF4915)
MDVASGEVIARGLSMPHSPRWYAGRLWVCESGAGALGFIDPDRRQYVPIAEVLGFTRGLDFAGNLAFVGLSHVRECAVFSGIPIVERLAEDRRTGGVCAIDLATGQVVALLRFETGVQEISPVTVLPGKRYPDLINDDQKPLENSFVVPDAALADVPASLRGPTESTHGAAGSGWNGSVPRVPPRVAAPARPRQAEAHRPGKAPALGPRACRVAPSLSRRPHPKRRWIMRLQQWFLNCLMPTRTRPASRPRPGMSSDGVDRSSVIREPGSGHQPGAA